MVRIDVVYRADSRPKKEVHYRISFRGYAPVHTIDKSDLPILELEAVKNKMVQHQYRQDKPDQKEEDGKDLLQPTVLCIHRPCRPPVRDRQLKSSFLPNSLPNFPRRGNVENFILASSPADTT